MGSSGGLMVGQACTMCTWAQLLLAAIQVTGGDRKGIWPKLFPSTKSLTRVSMSELLKNGVNNAKF